MGSYMRRRGVIGILFSQIDFWTHSRCLQSAPPPRWASHCPPFPIWNQLLAQHRTAYCWHSLLLLLCPELTTSCSSGGRVNIWAPGILEHRLGSGGWCPTIQLRSPPGAAVSVYDGGALGAAGRLVREIVPTKAAQCQVQAESSMHSKNTTCYQFHASKCHRSNTASHTISPLQWTSTTLGV